MIYSINIPLMYEDDYFSPTNNNDYDETPVDLIPSRHTVTRRNNVNHKMVKRRVHTSGCVGQYITDAETGEKYSSRVGSADEDLFFKVIVATGELKHSTNTLFYLSPTHYENHMCTTVDSDVLAKWQTKRNNRMKALSRVEQVNMNNVVVVH